MGQLNEYQPFKNKNKMKYVAQKFFFSFFEIVSWKMQA